MVTNSVAEGETDSVADNMHQIFIDILHSNEVTLDVVEVEAARESLVIGSVWGMARERMQDNDKERLQNTGEDDKLVVFPSELNCTKLSSATLFGPAMHCYLAGFLQRSLSSTAE